MSRSAHSEPTEGVERAAVEELARQYGTVLLQFFRRRLKDPREAEDLTQEVFVRLVRRGRVSDVGNVQGYLFECAGNALKDHLRKRKSRHDSDHEPFDPDTHGSEDFSADHVLIGTETLTRASRAILELPERTRTIFVLRRLEGLQYQEIAQRLGVSLSLVEKQMARAIAYLTQRMSEE
jgi:RNA polymerase sigma factor (sigma-70 family)